MEFIAHQRFCEWVCRIVAGVYFPHLHKKFGNMFHNRMVAKRHGFIAQGATNIRLI